MSTLTGMFPWIVDGRSCERNGCDRMGAMKAPIPNAKCIACM